jgi:hypothetical protein
VGPGNDLIIMANRSWAEIQRYDRTIPAPVLSGTSTGPEGDAPLVLVRADKLLSTGQNGELCTCRKVLVALRPFILINER